MPKNILDKILKMLDKPIDIVYPIDVTLKLATQKERRTETMRSIKMTRTVKEMANIEREIKLPGEMTREEAMEAMRKIADETLKGYDCRLEDMIYQIASEWENTHEWEDALDVDMSDDGAVIEGKEWKFDR